MEEPLFHFPAAPAPRIWQRVVWFPFNLVVYAIVGGVVQSTRRSGVS